MGNDTINAALTAIKSGMDIKTASIKYGLSETVLNDALQRALLPNPTGYNCDAYVPQQTKNVQETTNNDTDLWTKTKNYLKKIYESKFKFHTEQKQFSGTPEQVRKEQIEYLSSHKNHIGNYLTKLASYVVNSKADADVEQVQSVKPAIEVDDWFGNRNKTD